MQVQAEAERRNSWRYKVRDGIFAHLVSGIEAIGRVLDVSEGGFAIEYVGDEKTPHNHGTLLQLFGSGKSFLSDVPVRKISDYALPRRVDFSSVTTRRMGGAFEEMKPEQKDQLNGFIMENSIH